MTRPAQILLAALLLATAPSCKRSLEPGPEVLESLAVTLNLDPAVRDAAGCGTTLADACVASAPDPAAPLDFASSGYVSMFVDIEAVGSRGTRPFAWNGELALTPARGVLHPQLAPVRLVDGKATGVQIRLQRVAGRTVVFVEDRIADRNATPPSYASGASPTLYFKHPSIAQVQETRDESTSAMYSNNVEISAGELVVTRVGNSGFTVQDISADRFNSIYVYTYGNAEGVAEGSVLRLVSGTVSEFIGTTQIAFPEYGGAYAHCVTRIGSNEGVEDTEVDVGLTIVTAGCPPAMTCKGVEIERDGITYATNRCVPDDPAQAAAYDKLFGRRLCSSPTDTSCPTGMRCELDDEGAAHFCQVVPTPAPVAAWPTTRSGFPYCGPTHTDRENPLSTETYESRLITLAPEAGIQVEGLPICKHVDDITSVRSTCNPSDEVPDCTLARAGDRLLRDAAGTVCERGRQACKDTGVPWYELRSSCGDMVDFDHCEAAEPGDPLLRNDEGVVCRATMDDFIMGGFKDFGQWKVTFEDATGQLRCATVVADALVGWDPLAFQESDGTLTSITGTLKQTVFRSGSSFWMIEPRRQSDLVNN